MTINIPYEIGDKIKTEQGTREIKSLHIYIDENGKVANVRAYTGQPERYITLQKTTR